MRRSLADAMLAANSVVLPTRSDFLARSGGTDQPVAEIVPNTQPAFARVDPASYG